jgi:predicted pyridoxine 5'-phosphate oxidase superfamily flavin-nucleotide-binding protein
MAKTFDDIDEKMAAFLVAQPVFFVATAPLSADGHLNCSPKGNDGTFKVLGRRKVAYRDFNGSGVETISHLRENGRVVLMFCVFDGPPRIVRLHGRGRAVFSHDEDFEDLSEQFGGADLTRSFIVVDVERVSDSCGFGVPLMTFQGHRHKLERWGEKMGEDGLARYRVENNQFSLDGLPGVPDEAQTLNVGGG